MEGVEERGLWPGIRLKHFSVGSQQILEQACSIPSFHRTGHPVAQTPQTWCHGGWGTRTGDALGILHVGKGACWEGSCEIVHVHVCKWRPDHNPDTLHFVLRHPHWPEFAKASNAVSGPCDPSSFSLALWPQGTMMGTPDPLLIR